jgi:hypothetical protein
MAVRTESGELAEFGYKQELERSLVALMALVGGAYCFALQRHNTGEVIEGHRAGLLPAEAPIHPWP